MSYINPKKSNKNKDKKSATNYKIPLSKINIPVADAHAV
jgi:hypothetical protein